MACGTSACQSNCYKEEEEEGDARPQTGNINSRGHTVLDAVDGVALCSKCKEVEAMAASNHNHLQDRLCFGCFRSSLFGKFKLAVSSQSMISPSDKVLVAFSGGPSSRVALQFVYELQHKAQRNLDASRDKSLLVFGVGVAFIDESAVSLIPSNKVHKAIEEIELIVSSLAPPAKELHISPIESIFSEDCGKGRERLTELLKSISDVTGKEDLVEHMRMVSLQKIASDNGYSKLVMGSCTSRIACHVISAAVKGQGYGLPADVQYVDARWEVPVVLPLRDCLVQELDMLCQLDSLKTLQLINCPRAGINGLVSSFVALLQEENPSRERTIVRTAEKLTPFSFNKLSETNNPDDHFSSRRRHKLQNVKFEKSISADVLCPVCGCPLSMLELQSSRNRLGSCQPSGDIFAAKCCHSCSFQILPKESSSVEHFYSLLPEPMIRRVKNGIGADHSWLREQVEDCLLSDNSDNEDETCCYICMDN